MNTTKRFSVFYKLFSLLSVVRGYNILVLVIAQYLAALFVFSTNKSWRAVLFDYQLLFIVLASVFVVSAGYIINNFYDVKADLINRPVKSNIDAYVSQKTKLEIYFICNVLAVFFGGFISWKAAMFFAVYIFSIWFYSHKLKKFPFVGLLAASVLTILPFFAVFIYYKNFTKIIFVHASFLFFVLLLKQLIKDLSNLRGAFVNNDLTFPVKYGERKTRKLGILFVLLTFIPAYGLANYSAVGGMKYYFLISIIVLSFIGVFLWKANLKKHYLLLHTLLKLMLLAGILSLLFVDPSILVERVIDKLN